MLHLLLLLFLRGVLRAPSMFPDGAGKESTAHLITNVSIYVPILQSTEFRFQPPTVATQVGNHVSKEVKECHGTSGVGNGRHVSPNGFNRNAPNARYNPMSKLRWRKNKKAPKIPGHGQKVKAAVRPALPGTKLNVVNPLYYIRRIKNKLAKSGRQRTPT